MTATVNTLLHPIRHVLRLTLQAETPLSIGSGDADASLDAPLFRDWNGLPCLSGAAIAGVLRSLMADHDGEAAACDLFGHEDERSQQGAASRLMVSFGLAHDDKDRAVEGYRAPADVLADPVLRLLAEDAPVLRDHVALSHRGAASDHLKFDRASCPVGTRFSLELALDGAAAALEEDKKALLAVLRLFAVPYARFGGASRRGLGKLAVVRAAYAAIDRRGDSGRQTWIAYRQAAMDAMDVAGFQRLDVATACVPLDLPSCRRPVVGELRLDAKFLWRIGQGLTAWGTRDAEKPDLMPPREPVILWREGRGHVITPDTSHHVPIPGSALRGALAHRAEFHYRRLCGSWATDASVSKPDRLSDALFGAVRSATGGAAGAVLIDDILVDFAPLPDGKRTQTRTRNALDRHTGGVRLGKLYTDETLWQGPQLVIPMVVLTQPWGEPLERRLLTAFDWAVDDLCCGRLALGGREAAGDGLFEGSRSWRRGEQVFEDLAEAVA